MLEKRGEMRKCAAMGGWGGAQELLIAENTYKDKWSLTY